MVQHLEEPVLSLCILFFIIYTKIIIANSELQGYDPSTATVPYVGIYHAELFEEPQNNSEFHFVIPEGEKIWLGVTCKFNKAVKWVYNVDELSNPGTITFGILGREIDTTRFNDTDSYIFEAAFDMSFDSSKPLDNATYFACVAYENENLITIVSGNDLPSNGTEFQVLDNIDANIASAILEQLLEVEVNQNKNASGCVTTFYYKDDLKSFNAIHYSWDGSQFNNPYAEVDGVTLENKFRNIQQIERECVRNTYKNDSVRNIPPNKYQAYIFYADIGKERRVAKGVFSIRRNESEARKFYFSWENVPIEEMYYVSDIPDEMYDGQQLDLVTRISPYYFSVAPIVSVGNSNESSLFSGKDEDPDSQSRDWGTKCFRYDPIKISKSKVGLQIVNVHFPWINSSDWLTVTKTVAIKDSQAPQFFENSPPENVMFEEGTATVTINCTASGKPPPDIVFTTPRNDIDITENITKYSESSTLIVSLFNVSVIHEGNYICTASNFVDQNVTKFITVRVQLKDPGKQFGRTIGAIFGVASFFFLVVSVFLFRRIRAQKTEYERKTREAVQEFLTGCTSGGQKNIRNSSQSLNGEAVNSEYNPSKEIPAGNWNVGTEMLGHGDFAIVTKGTVALVDGERIVAVKKIMSPSNIDDFKSALYELKVMSCMEANPNILELVAACTENINQREVLIALEYCANGDLLSYLKKRRVLFSNLVINGKICAPREEKGDGNDYANVSSSSLFTTLDLLKWSFQVANGMTYIHSKNIIHGDLSARNLLMTNERMVKISDFGLARQITKNSSSDMEIEHGDALPWKWLPIESLKTNKLSKYSDVWAYGITLWEIFSLGEVPYPSMANNEDFLRQLENGLRMAKTKYVSEEVYDLMVQTWNVQPAERPSFSEIKKFFMSCVEQLAFLDNPDYHRNTQMHIPNLVIEPTTNYLQPGPQD